MDPVAVRPTHALVCFVSFYRRCLKTNRCVLSTVSTTVRPSWPPSGGACAGADVEKNLTTTSAQAKGCATCHVLAMKLRHAVALGRLIFTELPRCTLAPLRSLPKNLRRLPLCRSLSLHPPRSRLPPTKHRPHQGLLRPPLRPKHQGLLRLLLGLKHQGLPRPPLRLKHLGLPLPRYLKHQGRLPNLNPPLFRVEDRTENWASCWSFTMPSGERFCSV